MTFEDWIDLHELHNIDPHKAALLRACWEDAVAATLALERGGLVVKNKDQLELDFSGSARPKNAATLDSLYGHKPWMT